MSIKFDDSIKILNGSGENMVNKTLLGIFVPKDQFNHLTLHFIKVLQYDMWTFNGIRLISSDILV